jgi:hypothetical protein
MAFDTSLAVRIATVLDNTGLKKAEKGIKSLEKTTKSLGRTLGISLSTAAVVAYGKASVKAFAADEAAARRLATAVDNLGLSFSQTRVSDFIANLESSAAIADDVLRPAFQNLLTVTGSLTKSQELLNNAIQISRASGVDLATVTADLGKGYVGITRGLIKYNTGLTRAELQTKSFNEILGIMLAKSAGSAEAYLTTTSYKLDVLTVAAGNAQETIGAGLVDAFAKIAGGSSASDAAKTIDSIAKGINRVTSAAASAVQMFMALKKAFDQVSSLGGLLGEEGRLFDRFREPAPVMNTNRQSSPAGSWQRTAQQRVAEAAAAKRNKEMLALQNKQLKAQKALTAEQKKQAMAKKQSALFDLDQIQLVAALQGKLTKEEELRVKLQLALLTGNTEQAKKLADQLADSIDKTGNLKDFINTIPDAPNPFAGWDEWLKTFTKNLATVTGSTIPTTGGGVSPAPVTSVPSSNAMPANAFNTLGSINASTRTADEARRLYGGMGSSQPIVIQIDGREIASVVQNQGLQGNNPIINRLGSFS